MKKIWGAMVLIALSFGVMSFLLPIYSQELALNGMQIGGLFSLFSLIILLAKPVIGKWLDQVGYKPVLTLGMLLYAVCFLIFAFMDKGAGLYIARSFEAVGAAMVSLAIYHIATSKGKESGVGSELGRFTACTTWGSFIGLFIFFSDVLSWERLFLVFAGAALIASGLVAMTKNTCEVQRAPKRIKTKQVLPPGAIKLIGVNFILAMTTSMVAPILIIYLQEKFPVHIIWICMIFLPGALISGILPARLGALGDRYNRAWVMLIGFVLCMIAMLFIPATQSIFLVALLCALDEVGGLLYGPAKQALFYKMAGADESGYKYGIYQTVQSIGIIIGPLLGGMLYDRGLATMVFYATAAGLAVGGVLVYLFFIKKQRIKEVI